MNIPSTRLHDDCAIAEVMGDQKAWFELRTPADLLAKLKADGERLRAEPADSHAAFDFFVTAWHLADWVYPGR